MTFTPVAECLKVELSLPVSMTKICLLRIQTSDLPHERQMSNVPLYTVRIQKDLMHQQDMKRLINKYN